MIIKTKKLSGVPETMLYTFFMRYLESKRPDGIISDPEYEEIFKQINLDYTIFEPYPEESPLFFACRSLIIDRATKEFITRNPCSTIVSFGSGLDFRFKRVDNGSIQWCDVDLPEAIEIREAILGESDREHLIPSSALDFTWSTRIDSKSPIFFIAEGLFIYFTSEEVKSFLVFLSNTYPGSMLLLDSSTTLYLNSTRKGTPYPYVNRMCSLWKWSINSAYEFEDYAPGISVVETWRPMEIFGSRTPQNLRDLFTATELPDFVKEQIIGMSVVYLLQLGPLKSRGKTKTGRTMPDINLKDLYI